MKYNNNTPFEEFMYRFAIIFGVTVITLNLIILVSKLFSWGFYLTFVEVIWNAEMMKSVDMRDFNYLSASWEIKNVEFRKFGEPSKSGNPEPSPKGKV